MPRPSCSACNAMVSSSYDGMGAKRGQYVTERVAACYLKLRQ